MATQSGQAMAAPPLVPLGQNKEDAPVVRIGGPSSDRAAIAKAAHAATPGDPLSVARLAAVASSASPIAATRTNAGIKAQSGKTKVSVSNRGRAVVSTDGGPMVSLGVSSASGSVTVLDTAVVQTGVAPDTDVVTSPTEVGAQVVAVLGSAAAPKSVDFALDLPATADVVLQTDGSIAIMDSVAVERLAPADEARLSGQIEAILLRNAAKGKITDAQWAAIAALPKPPTETVVERSQVAGIDAPWAVDAHGVAVPTHFELTASGVRQVVDTNANTAYPVTIDPSFWVKITHPAGYAFAVAIGVAMRGAVYAAGGSCRNESAYDLWVCWGGRGSITSLDAYGGGVTIGSTYYYAAKDPKTNHSASVYSNLLSHEAAHYEQWIVLGPAFAPSYFAAEGLGRLATGKAGCGNIFEILAGLAKGQYTC